MVTVLALLGVVGVLFAAAVLSTREQGLLAEASPDDPDVPLPADPLTPADVGRLRFSMAARGYRMSEVDLALERLAKELADRDERIGLLEAAARGKSKPEPVAPAPVEPPLASVEPSLASRTAEPPAAPENAGEAVVLGPPVDADPEPAAPAPVEPPAPEPAPVDPPELEDAPVETPSRPITGPTAWSSPSAVPAFPVIDAPDAYAPPLQPDLPPQPDLPSELVAQEQADDRADVDDPADDRPR